MYNVCTCNTLTVESRPYTLATLVGVCAHLHVIYLLVCMSLECSVLATNDW